MSPLSKLWQVLVGRAREDPELAGVLRDAVRELSALLDDAAHGNAAHGDAAHGDAAPDTVVLGDAASASEAGAREAPAPVVQELSSDDLEMLLRHFNEGGVYGDASGPTTSGGERAYNGSSDAVLAPLAQRFRLKSHVARWRATGADSARIPELLSRIGEADGLDRSLLDPVVGSREQDWGCLADSYEAAGIAADLLSGFADAGALLSRGSPFAEAVVAAAEAQSAVRSAYWAVRGRDAQFVRPDPEKDDPEQLDLFRWLREATQLHQVYVERYMRWDDPAPPTGLDDVVDRLRGIASRAGISLHDPLAATKIKLLNAVAYHAERLAKEPDYWDAENERDSLFKKIKVAVDAGVPPSDTRFRDLLLPIAETLPDADDPAISRDVGRVLEALYEHQYRLEDAKSNEASGSAVGRPAHIEEVARLLAGKRLAIFGGDVRPDALRAHREAFGLAESNIEWVATRSHQSTEQFDSVVKRSDVVVLLIRWSSHSFSDLSRMCATHDVHFVRAPRGFNPSAIAHDILSQVGNSLRGE